MIRRFFSFFRKNQPLNQRLKCDQEDLKIMVILGLRVRGFSEKFKKSNMKLLHKCTYFIGFQDLLLTNFCYQYISFPVLYNSIEFVNQI